MFAHGTLYALGPGIWLAAMIALVVIPTLLSVRGDDRNRNEND